MKTLRSLEILNYLKERQSCSISELMERFNVSQATIHRDVTELARQKIIRKVHGGVAIASAVPEGIEPANSHFSERVNKNLSKKTLIAEEAVKHIKDGGYNFSGFLDYGISTGAEITKSAIVQPDCYHQFDIDYSGVLFISAAFFPYFGRGQFQLPA